MEQKSKNRLISAFGLIIILALASFMFLYKLNVNPPGFYIDEASLGYNSYSLLKTGRDEYGKVFPLMLRLYGTYLPPLFAYFAIPGVALFGLNVFAIRAPAAVCGIISILVFFFFLKYLKPSKSGKLPLIGAFLFAISPWLIFYSRIGYEVIPAFLLFSLGILFVWRGFARPVFLILGPALISFSAYAAYAERFILPLFLIALPLFFYKELRERKIFKYYLWGVLAALLIQIPLLKIIGTPAFFPKTNLFYQNASIEEFLSQLFTYFSPRSLFFLPDPDLQRSIPDLSVFYPWMVVPYFSGIYSLWQNRSRLYARFILMLAIIGAIPAALAHDPFATHRALPLALPLITVISIGTVGILKKLSKFAGPVFLLTIIFSGVLLWRSYFILLPQERARAWGYGISKLAGEIQKRPDIIFVIDESRTKPTYINLAFFLKIQPEKLQSAADPKIKENYYQNTDFSGIYKFANIETRGINWQTDIYKTQVLVGDTLAISESQAKEHFLTKIFEIKDPLGNPIFVGFLTNPRLKCLKTDFYSPLCHR